MSVYSRITLVAFCFLAAIFIVAGCRTDSKATDKTMRVTVQVTGMT